MSRNASLTKSIAYTHFSCQKNHIAPFPRNQGENLLKLAMLGDTATLEALQATADEKSKFVHVPQSIYLSGSELHGSHGQVFRSEQFCSGD